MCTCVCGYVICSNILKQPKDLKIFFWIFALRKNKKGKQRIERKRKGGNERDKEGRERGRE
jgi:hypothetical protein